MSDRPRLVQQLVRYIYLEVGVRSKVDRVARANLLKVIFPVRCSVLHLRSSRHETPPLPLALSYGNERNISVGAR